MVDNGSTDCSVSFVEENYPAVTVINSGGNIGYSAANNLGVGHARGKYVVLLNNDVEVSPGWLEPLVAELESNPAIAACQPKLLHILDRNSFEYAGAAGGFMDYLGYPYLRGRVFSTIETDEGQYDNNVDLFWASGAALVIRKEAFVAIGGLDEDFVHHMEEIDLCWRLHLLGYRLRVRTDSVVYHHAGGTIKPDSYRKLYWNHRNSVLMLLKNYSIARLLWVLPSRLLLDIMLTLKSLVTLDLRRIAAVMAAYTWLAFHPMLICRKRREVQQQRKISDGVIASNLFPVSLVFSYYLQRKKTFTEITGKAGGGSDFQTG